MAWLAAILVIFVGLALAYARAVPPWQAPDEPAHYNYVKFLAEHGQLPVLQPGDYPARLVPLAPKPTVAPDIALFRYESHQPPLYYAVAAVLYRLGAGVFALRALSVFFGALLLVVAYFCVRLIFPRWPAGALAAAAFVGFIPMHLFMAASIENDTLAELVLSSLLLLYLAAVHGKAIPGLWIATGLLLGAALLTKATIYLPAGLLTAGIIAVGAGFKPARSPEAKPALGSFEPARSPEAKPASGEFETRPYRAVLAVGLTAAIVSGWWFVRNGLIYGWTDPAGLGRQDAVNGAQLHQGALTGTTVSHFVVTTFHSFWAQFGWMTVPVSNATYAKLWAFSLLVAGGLAALAFRARWSIVKGTPAPIPMAAAAERPVPPAGVDPPETAPPGLGTRDSGPGTWDSGPLLWSLAGLLAVWLSVVANLMVYNLKFVQAQGRYLFPALVPIALAVVCGIAGLFPRRLQTAALGLLCLGLVWFTLLSLRHDIIPAFTP
ncbi:MAG: DUF2142 domain-containing protein [Chloroflexota bacterium]|nr:DUF2142 domain-containing protein [Chloroflexota bacterium]